MVLANYILEHNRYCNIIGIFIILSIASLISFHRSRINYKLVLKGLLLQATLGAIVLKTSVGLYFVESIAAGVGKLYQFAESGSRFVFGSLANPASANGFVFAFTVLPVIVFFAALMSLLFYCGIAQYIVTGMSMAIRPILGTAAAETVCAAANSFLGQTEAPLLIKQSLKHMTRSEMFLVMVAGMGTISGALLVSYAAMGVPVVHLLTSCIMSIPATIIIAKIMYPETEKHPSEEVKVSAEIEKGSSNVFDAIANGTMDGLNLVLAIAAMLISFLALLAMVDSVLEYFMSTNLKVIFGYLFSPFGYLLGFDEANAMVAGQLLGIKIAANELIAYGEMVKMNLSEREIALLTYALCGFANFSSIGIQIGGIGALVPEKRKWLTELGLYAVLGGTLSNLLCAMIAGLLL